MLFLSLSLGILKMWLTLVSKILERLVHMKSHIVPYYTKIQSYMYISDGQFGFRPTQEAIRLASRTWHHIMENKSSVYSLCFL